MLVGEAEVLVVPQMAMFRKEMEAGAAPALGSFEKKAEESGARAGAGMSKGFGKGTSGITNVLSSLGLPLGTFGGHLDKTAASMGRVEAHGSGMAQSLAGLGGGVLAGATAAIGAFGVASIAVAVKGEQVTTSIANSANISTDAAKKISSAFAGTMGHMMVSGQELGKSYAGVAGVLGQLNGKALSSAQALGAMTSAADLADGGQISLESSTQDLTKVLQAYHLQIGESSKAADILYSTNRLTGVGIDQLTNTLTRVRGKLGDLAPSLQESASLVGALAKNGVTGRQSMAALNGAFTTLVGGGKKTEEMAKALGISIFDQNGKFVGMRSIIEQLQPKLAGLTQQAQLQATKALFGAAANKQMIDIINQGPAAFDKSTQAVTRSGAAHEAAKKQAETFSGQIKVLKATAIDLAEKFGNILIPKIVLLGKAISDSIGWLQKHKAAAVALATVITTILGAAIGSFVAVKVASFISGTGRMVSAVLELGKKMLVTVGVMQGAEGAMVADADAAAVGVDAALIGTGIGAAVVALGIAAIELKEHWSEVMTAMESAAVKAANVIIEALNEMKSVLEGVLSGGITTLLQEAGVIGNVIPNIGKVGESSGGLTQTQVKGGEQVEAALKGAHQKVLDTGGGIMAFFESKGLTPAQAAGIVGNIQQESSLNPSAPGGGLFQDIGSRAASGRGSITHQLESAWRELQGMPSTLASLKKARTPEEAARIFSQQFERPGTPMLGKRERYAAEALKAHPHSNAHTQATEKDTEAIRKHNAALEKAVAGLSEHTKAAAKHAAAHHAATRLFTPHGGSTGFFEGPGTNYTKGKEEEIAARLDMLAKAEKIRLTGISGYRTPAHSMAVGGFANDPHTRGEASDTEGAQTIPEATLRKFGLTRPFAGAKEADHIQLLPGVAALKKGGSEVGLGGLELKKVAAQIEAIVKAEEKKRVADQKAGTASLTKMIAAIHKGGVKELEKVVGNTHEVTMKQIEKDHHSTLGQLLTRLSGDHTKALDDMVRKLVATHKAALEALNKALIKAAEKKKVEGEKHEDVINTQLADNAATQIADSTKVTLDHIAEKGLTGTELAAAQAQTNVDAIKQATDIAIGQAKLAVDQSEGKGELPEELAHRQLINAENAAKVSEAQALQTLELANNTASEAKKAEEKNTKATEENTKALKEGEGATTAPPVNFTILGHGLDAGQIFADIGWAFKVGALGSPPATVVPAVA